MSESPIKILVADDTQAERLVAREALTRAGYEVCEALDGIHSLEVFARELPALVMLDVVMPKMTGIEACRILKARMQSDYLPVLMVSTKNTVNARVEGLRSGADDFLGKPYDAEELVARIEVLLRTRARLRSSSSDETQSNVGSPTSPTTVTGEATARDFSARLEQEFMRAERYSDPLACLKIEVDAEAGAERPPDETLVADVAVLRKMVEDHVRKVDIPFELGAHCYTVILPNTHFPGALAAAERISRAAQRVSLSSRRGAAATVSIGVSFFPNKDTKSAGDLNGLVNLALDRARAEGGGHICLYQHQGYLYVPEE
ncbi:MAG: GGDEF domain-containing response regulator [Nannocystaceae bacterium]